MNECEPRWIPLIATLINILLHTPLISLSTPLIPFWVAGEAGASAGALSSLRARGGLTP